MIDILAQDIPSNGFGGLISAKDILILIGAIITGWLSYLGSKATAKSQEKSKQIETSADNWDRLVTQQRKHHESVIKDITERHQEDLDELKKRHEESLHIIEVTHKETTEMLQDKINSLEKRIDLIQIELGTLRGKYSAALEFIKHVISTLPEDTVKKLPDIVKGDIFF